MIFETTTSQLKLFKLLFCQLSRHRRTSALELSRQCSLIHPDDLNRLKSQILHHIAFHMVKDFLH